MFVLRYMLHWNVLRVSAPLLI